MSQAMWFATRVWFTAVGLAPLLTVLLNFIYQLTGIGEAPSGMMTTSWIVVFPMFFVGFLFSLPSWFLLCLTTRYLLARYADDERTFRRRLLAASLLLTLLPFIIIMAFSDWSMMDMFVRIAVVSYAIVIGYGVMNYEVEERLKA